MTRYLLLFSSALFLTAVNAQAESFWLILQNSSYGIEKIEMKTFRNARNKASSTQKVQVFLVICA